MTKKTQKQRRISMDGFAETEIQTFDSPFSSSLSPSAGSNLKVGIEDEYQDTVPFDDTAVLESPLIETELVNLYAETEVLDNSECIDDIDKEVVLDSDDEGINRTDVASVMKGISSAATQRSAGGPTLGYVGYLRKPSNAVGEQLLGAYCSAISSLSDKRSDCDPNSVHTVTHYQKLHAVNESGVSILEEQMKDRILNKVDQAHDSWECNAKGSGTLDEIKNSDLMTKVSSDTGKNASLVTCDHEVATLSYIESQEPGDPSQAIALDFVDHYLSVIDVNLPQEIENRKATRIKSPPALSAKGLQSLARKAILRTKFQASRSFDWDENRIDDGGDFILRKRKELILDCESHAPRLEERNLSEECKEKLQGAITSSTSIDLRFMVHNCNEISETIQTAAITKSDTNFVAELDKQFDAESSRPQQENDGIGTDAAEIFDVGFDTQMAAEAMEELLYAPLPNSNATSLQGLESIFEDSPKGSMKNKAFSSVNEKPESGFIGSRSNRTKRHSNKLSSSFEILTENQKVLNLDLPITKKVARRKQTNISTSITKKVARRKPTNISTSKSVKHNLLCEEQITGSFSPIACRTRRNASAHSLKRVEGSRSNHDVMEVSVVKRRRNSTEEIHMFDVRKKCPRLGSKISKQATNSKENDLTDPVVAASVRSNLDMWTYPKRKRTRPSHKKSEKVDVVNSILRFDAAENIKLDVLSDMKAKASPVHKKKASKLPLLKELTRLGFADSLPDFTSKDLRRRRKLANVRILFSQSLDDDIMKQQRKISARLGISVALCCSDATHFVTDRFVRTSNMLEAIAAGKPVVTHLWLESCAQASCLVDEKMYILRDAKREKEIGFSMPISLARARENPLLKDRRVFTTPNVKPGREIIESLVKAVNGQALENIETDAAKGKRLPDDLLILSCEEDYSVCEPFLEEGAAVYSSELLLNGIVTQKLDYKRHELFIDNVKRKRNRPSNSMHSRKSKFRPCPRK